MVNYALCRMFFTSVPLPTNKETDVISETILTLGDDVMHSNRHFSCSNEIRYVFVQRPTFNEPQFSHSINIYVVSGYGFHKASYLIQ